MSATVSGRVIFQSAMRESMISSAGSTKSTAASASATVTPGPTRRRPRTNAISGSAFGCRNREIGAVTPSGRNIESSSTPKSG